MTSVPVLLGNKTGGNEGLPRRTRRLDGVGPTHGVRARGEGVRVGSGRGTVGRRRGPDLGDKGHPSQERKRQTTSRKT